MNLYHAYRMIELDINHVHVYKYNEFAVFTFNIQTVEDA